MNYTADEVMQYAAEENVKFVRLAFCDIRGRQKNIAILPDELGRAFRYGIAIDASAIAGFGGEVHSDLFLHPDTSTLTFLPWLSEQGKVIRMFCHITYPDGTPFEADTRSILAKAVDCAHEQGVSFAFGSEMEFYLFKLDENGEPDSVGYDQIPQPDGTIRFYFEFAGREGGIERAESYDVILSIANWEVTPEGEWLREDPDNTWLKDEWVVTVTPEMKGEAQ